MLFLLLEIFFSRYWCIKHIFILNVIYYSTYTTACASTWWMDCNTETSRCWDEYVAGFGHTDGNFWLGLDAMHALTTAQPMSLQLNVEPFSIPPFVINYSEFLIGDAASDYLLTISGHTTTSPTEYHYSEYIRGWGFPPMIMIMLVTVRVGTRAAGGSWIVLD